MLDVQPQHPNHSTSVHGSDLLPPQSSAAPLALESQRLLQGRNEILIRHGGEIYRLRHTRNDKLILTK